MTEKTLLEKVFKIATIQKLQATKVIRDALNYGPRFTPNHIQISDEERAAVLSQSVEKILGGGLLVNPLGDYLKHHFFRRVGDEFVLSKLDFADLEKFLANQFRHFPTVLNNLAAQLFEELALDEETDGEAVQGLAQLLDELEPIFHSDEAWQEFSQALQARAQGAVKEAVKMIQVFAQRGGKLTEITIRTSTETVTPMWTWGRYNQDGVFLSGQSGDVREALQASMEAHSLPPGQFVARACEQDLAALRQAAKALVANHYPLDLAALEGLLDKARLRLSAPAHLHVVAPNKE